MTPGIDSLLWFLAVVALIPLALWLLKRSPMGGGASGAAGLRSVGVLPLSASQRVVTVEVGAGTDRRWLVLGVTPQHIALLHAMPPQPETPAQAVVPFTQLLARLKSGARPGDGR